MCIIAKGTIGNDQMTKGHCLMQLGVSRCCKPPAGPGKRPGGVQVAKPPEDLKILHFTVPR